MIFNGLIYAVSELDKLTDLDWKKMIIVCTAGAFVIGCIIAIKQIKKDFDNGKYDEPTEHKKGGRK